MGKHSITKKPHRFFSWLFNVLILALFLSGLFFIGKPYLYDYLNGKKAKETLHVVSKQQDVQEKRKELAEKKDLYQSAQVKEITKEAYQRADADHIIFNYGIGKITFVEKKAVIPVVEGITNEGLLVGAGTLKPNQEVGKRNFALAGHRLATNQSILFSPLKELQNGEHIVLTIGKHSATYIVTDKKVIEPTEVSYMDDDQGEGLLTLICCTDDGTKRWMVRGTLA